MTQAMKRVVYHDLAMSGMEIRVVWCHNRRHSKECDHFGMKGCQVVLVIEDGKTVNNLICALKDALKMWKEISVCIELNLVKFHLFEISNYD